jgi:hypothetical protein
MTCRGSQVRVLQGPPDDTNAAFARNYARCQGPTDTTPTDTILLEIETNCGTFESCQLRPLL